MRLAQAPAPMFTDAAGNYEKARALSAGEHQGQRAVVNTSNATGVSAQTPAPVITPTHPCDRTQSKLAASLSSRSLGKASNGAGNEHNVCTETDSDNRGSH